VGLFEIMDIAQVAREHLKLERIFCRHEQGCDLVRLESVDFLFEGNVRLALGVDLDSDELFWDENLSGNNVDASDIIPWLAEAYGLRVIWCWEMKNHQGYFDALQMELSSADLSRSVILQFKAMASGVFVYVVNEVPVAGLK